MNSFHPSLSFHSIEAAVNGVARLARTQGFRIHQRKSPQKNNYELQGLASFGCTAPGCGWFINLKRIPIDGPSTSTAPAEQWIVYTLYDSHKSTCKPARSRRRRPSISSISSLETENTEDELPPELLRPYERSPSLPILMHARGSRPEDTDVTAPSQVQTVHPTSLAVVNGHADPSQSEAPDPVALSNYIQDLLASLEAQAPQPENTATSLDPRTFLTALNDPLPMPPEFTFPSTDFLQSNATSSTSYPFNTQQPFSEALYNGHAPEQDLSGNLASSLDTLPDRLQRAASMLQTIDPSQLHSPAKTNGYHEPGPSMSAFFDHKENRQDSRNVTNNQYQEYAAPVSVDDWSDSDDSGEPDLSQSFLQHSYDAPEEVLAYNAEIWPQHDNQNHYNGVTHEEDENEEEEQVHEYVSGEMSSSDSDIPAEVLLNINTSRSKGSNSPDTGTSQRNTRTARRSSYNFDLDPPDLQQPDYAPYGPVQPLVHTATPAVGALLRSVYPPIFPVEKAARDESEEHFDIYKIFYSFEEAEAAILANARKMGLPLKIRYRPNALDSGPNARKQACLECLRLCGYRIYLKDDHRSQWRVINMEGGHKQSCSRGKSKSKTQRGTHPFRNYRNKDKDSMQVSVPVWEPPGGKRKCREASMSTDRSSSPSILVVTHSDAVMKSVKTIGPGFTPPREYWYHSPSPEPVKKSKNKGNGKVKKNGRSPEKAIEVDDSADPERDALYYGPGIEDDYLPPPLGNNFTHPDSRLAENDSPQADQFARKRLPTTQQLLHGSSRPGIQPRHKIPTKPLGRSPAKTRERRERRQANGTSSHIFPRTAAANKEKFGSGIHDERLPGESSANDDDEDMFVSPGRFSQRTLSNGQSSRALRSTRRSNGTSKQIDEVQANGRRTRRGQSPDPDFIPLIPTASATLSNGTHTAPSRSRERPRLEPRKRLNKNIGLKMSLSQAGFSDKQLRFLHKGGYSTVKDIAREGLACNVADFSTFESWLNDHSIPPEVMHDAQLTRQTIRARVRAVAEEVRVRSTIIWEAAGMMEEGSDVGEDGGSDAVNNTTAPHQDSSKVYEQDNRSHTADESVRPPKRLRHTQTQQAPEQQKNGSHGHHTRDYRSGSSSSSGTEYLGEK